MTNANQPKKVALLTAGGLAPCLSSAIGGLIERYTEVAPEIEIIAYRSGYKGLLLGDSYRITPEVRANAALLHRYGGSPIGNSRVKLTNLKDCLKRGLVREGQDPQKVAADRLVQDGVDVLHTIGGDDTNTAAAELAAFLARNNYGLSVIGLPKTVDNDVYPIRQSLGAWTAAEQGARFFGNVVSELGANPRMLIVHEVMGRNCGWLTAATARSYRAMLGRQDYVPQIGLSRERREIHGVYLPEMSLDIAAEAARLKAIMERQDNVNLFVSEGAGVPKHRCRDAGKGPGGAEGCVRPRQAGRRQSRQMVRRAVFEDDRSRKSACAKERLFCPGGGRQLQGPASDQELRRAWLSNAPCGGKAASSARTRIAAASSGRSSLSASREASRSMWRPPGLPGF